MESHHEASAEKHLPSVADSSPQETLEALGQSHGPSNATPSKNMSGPAFEWHVLGKLNGKPVEALADTGATCNAISASCANERHLRPDPGSTRERIRLPSGKYCKSLGMTTLQFQFDGEDEVHNVHCNIVPKLQQACVLASGFLRTTKTLTKFKSRLKEVPLPEEHRMSLGLMRDGAVDRDSNNSAINGYVAGAKCLAIPDSGSSIMALSGSHVRSLELRIDTRKRCKVKYIDGSSAWTSGTVTASWQFSSSRMPFWNTLYSMLCYLLLRPPALLPLARRPWTVQVWHVIEDMDVDAILSIDFIKEHDIFRAYESSFVTKGLDSFAAKIYGICSSAYPKGNKRPETLASSFCLDIQSPNPFSYDMLVREDARRSEIEDTIASLAPDFQDAARLAEIQRRQFWDDRRHQQELRGAQQQQQQGAAQLLGESTTPDRSSSASSAHATAPPPKRRLLRRRRFWLRNWR
ncbi:hypothetical protein Daus18300_001397 [Diaporthe australafricana]|uniref:Peptidase A2 domain-containing protein n=1 Tax=Diaporthe australafricana TaxID=127596 RepID=A0ABR3XWD3_9PEZI